MMDPVTQAILIGLPATLIGFLTWWRSRKVDKVAEQSGVATESRAGTAQIIEGLNQLVDNLQDDNRLFREDIKFITQRLDTAIKDRDERLDRISKERDELRLELNRMVRKYGELAI